MSTHAATCAKAQDLLGQLQSTLSELGSDLGLASKFGAQAHFAENKCSSALAALGAVRQDIHLLASHMRASGINDPGVQVLVSNQLRSLEAARAAVAIVREVVADARRSVDETPIATPSICPPPSQPQQPTITPEMAFKTLEAVFKKQKE